MFHKKIEGNPFFISIPPQQVRGFGIKKFPEDMDAVLELKQKQLNLVEKKQAKVKKTIIISSQK